MKLKIFLSILILGISALAIDVKLSQLPLTTSGSSANTNDSLPYVSDNGSSLITKRLKLSEIVNIPSLSSALALKESLIAPDLASKYWRGDKTFQILDTSVVPENINLYWTQTRFDDAFSLKTTTDLFEGSNLYYTQGRFDTAFGLKSTSDLIEGANLYYTQTRFDDALSAKTTTDLAEGSNLYYTDIRAQSAISTTAPLNYVSGIIGIDQSNTTNDGYLSSTDWNIFNNKQDSLVFGDLTGSTPFDITGGTGAVIGSGSNIAVASGYYFPTTLDQTSWDGKLDASASFSGDVSGSYNSTSVDKIKGVDVSASTPTSGQALVYNGSQWEPGTAGTASPLTTKGDLYGFSTVNDRIPIGLDGQILTADSSDPLGVSWQAAAASGADVNLSNLVYPTAVPVDISPSSDQGANLGENSKRWGIGYIGNLYSVSSGPNISVTNGYLHDGTTRSLDFANRVLIDTANNPAMDWSTASSGTISMETHRLTNVVDPISAQDVATKNYVDANAGGGGAHVVDSVGSPQSISAGTAIAITGQIVNGPNVVFISGNGGAVVVTATPSITACIAAGEQLQLIGGANNVTLQDESALAGSKLKLNGNLVIGSTSPASYTASFVCDAASGNWIELSRY